MDYYVMVDADKETTVKIINVTNPTEAANRFRERNPEANARIITVSGADHDGGEREWYFKPNGPSTVAEIDEVEAHSSPILKPFGGPRLELVGSNMEVSYKPPIGKKRSLTIPVSNIDGADIKKMMNIHNLFIYLYSPPENPNIPGLKKKEPIFQITLGKDITGGVHFINGLAILRKDDGSLIFERDERGGIKRGGESSQPPLASEAAETARATTTKRAEKAGNALATINVIAGVVLVIGAFGLATNRGFYPTVWLILGAGVAVFISGLRGLMANRSPK